MVKLLLILELELGVGIPVGVAPPPLELLDPHEEAKKSEPDFESQFSLGT